MVALKMLSGPTQAPTRASVTAAAQRVLHPSRMASTRSLVSPLMLLRPPAPPVLLVRSMSVLPSRIPSASRASRSLASAIQPLVQSLRLSLAAITLVNTLTQIPTLSSTKTSVPSPLRPASKFHTTTSSSHTSVSLAIVLLMIQIMVSSMLVLPSPSVLVSLLLLVVTLSSLTLASKATLPSLSLLRSVSVSTLVAPRLVIRSLMAVIQYALTLKAL